MPHAEPTVPALGYGAANVGNLFRPLTDDEAWESGIRFYDTAPHYGLGLSERRLGAFLRTKRRDEYVLSTKAGRLLRPNPDAADVLPACAERGTGIVAASVFNSGLLAQSEPRRDGRYEYGSLPDELWARLVRIADVCRSYDVPLPAAALQFPLRSALVRSVVVGGSRPEQLRQNAEYAALPIPGDLRRELAAEGLIPA